MQKIELGRFTALMAMMAGSMLAQAPAADALPGPGGFQQALLLPLAQPVLGGGRRHREPLLQVGGTERIGKRLAALHRTE